MKILCIALDGATFKILSPALEKGHMPFLKRIKEEGVSGELETVIPPLSTYSWPTMFTGVNSAKSGVFALSAVLNESSLFDVETVPINFSKIRTKSLWKILSDKGKTVGVVNIPVTYPVEKLKGFIISGFLTPSSAKNYYYPPEIEKYLKDYEIDIKFGDKLGIIPDHSIDKKEIMRKQYEVTRKRFEACRELINNYSPEFFIVNFKGVDVIQHIFWDDREVIFKYLTEVDVHISSLQKAMAPDATIIFSDHGFHERATKYFHINSWLRDNNYLRQKETASAKSRSLFYTYGLKISQMFPFLKDLIPESVKQRVMSEKNVFEQIDWKSTKAFGTRWGLYINKKLFPNDDEIEKITQEINGKLLKYLCPVTGNKVFQKIAKGNEIFNGPCKDNLPDMVFLPFPDYKVNPNFHNDIVIPRKEAENKSGDHNADPYGVFMAEGEGIQQGNEINGAKLVDLAPTILHMMGFKIPKRMDGVVLSELFSPDSIHCKKEILFEDDLDDEEKKETYNLSEEEQDDVEEKLRSLGYLD